MTIEPRSKIATGPGDKVFVTTLTRNRGTQSGVEVDMEFSFVFHHP
jgi:hypothetical protein